MKSAEGGVDAVAIARFEAVAAHAVFGLEVADDGLGLGEVIDALITHHQAGLLAAAESGAS